MWCDPCKVCGQIIPEPPKDFNAWSGGFAENH